MWETLYPADGIGLAAPQINRAIKLFIVDSKKIYDRLEPEEREEFFKGDTGIQETFINANIVEYSDSVWTEKEGCLSIPSISEDVERSWSITIEYFNRDFQKQLKNIFGNNSKSNPA